MCNFEVYVSQPSINDKLHSLRALVGNGLRPVVWREFLDRYGENIHVMEFYATSEGNILVFNYYNDFGCAGRLSPFSQVRAQESICI